MRIHHQTIALCLVLLSCLSSTSFATTSSLPKRNNNNNKAQKNPFRFTNNNNNNINQGRALNKNAFVVKENVVVGSASIAANDLATTAGNRHRGGNAKSNIIRFTSAETTVRWGMWFAMLAGFNNGVFMSGFLSLLPKQGVAAVTGAWTNSALGWASQNRKLFVSQTSVLLCFILGSAIYGLIDPRPQKNEVNRSITSVALMLNGLLLLSAIWILDHANNFGRAAAFEVCCLAAVASGIQNSLTSGVTQNLCRTTHFTGISSDIGTFLGQVLRGNTANAFKLQSFLKLAACFWLGGAAAFWAAQKFGADALLFPVTMNLLLAAYTRFVA